MQTQKSIKTNRIENPEIDPHKYVQLSFYKSAKAVQLNKTFQQNGARAIGYPQEGKKKQELSVALYTKRNLE